MTDAIRVSGPINAAGLTMTLETGKLADLVVLDARDITGAPVATVHLPARVPAGFHGNWCPDV